MKELWWKAGMRIAIAVIGALILPFVILTISLQMGKSAAMHAAFVSPVTVLLILMVGLGSISILPIKVAWRVVLGVLYVPSICILLFLWSAIYACDKFQACF